MKAIRSARLLTLFLVAPVVGCKEGTLGTLPPINIMMTTPVPEVVDLGTETLPRSGQVSQPPEQIKRPPEQVSQPPEGVAPPQEKAETPAQPKQTRYTLVCSPTDAKATLVLARQEEQYRLWLPCQAPGAVGLIEEESRILEPIIRAAIVEVERLFGSFEKRVEICLVTEIRCDPPDQIRGLAWWVDERPVLAVTVRDFRELARVLIHELVHLRLRERGDSTPASWLNEGFSHYAETLGEPNRDRLWHLDGLAPVPTYEDLDRHGDDSIGRAFGAALVYWWVKHEGKTLDEALKLARGPRSDWPEPKAVLEYGRSLTAPKQN